MIVRASHPEVGEGLFAGAHIAQGDFIAEYTGRKISSKFADTLKTRYLFEVDERWTIDGELSSNIARYINHSCIPNAEAEIHDSHIFILATRDIRPGEEITIDYGQEYFDEFIKPHGCKCARCATSSR